MSREQRTQGRGQMAEWHIPEELLARFLRLEASREESQRVMRHLLTECPQCLEMAHRVTTGGKTGWEAAYEEVFARALEFASAEERRLALEKLRGWALWSELEPLGPQLRLAAVESDPRFHTFGFYQRLLEASRWYSYREPAEAVDIVRLAVLVTERLDSAGLGEMRIADLKAAAW